MMRRHFDDHPEHRIHLHQLIQSDKIILIEVIFKSLYQKKLYILDANMLVFILFILAEWLRYLVLLI